MSAAPVRTLRRWGLSWLSIIKCKLGFHHWWRFYNGYRECGRCGEEWK